MIKKKSAIKRKLIRKIFNIRGLSFNHNAFNKDKVFQFLLQGGALKDATDIVIWHDFINKSFKESCSNLKALYNCNYLQPSFRPPQIFETIVLDWNVGARHTKKCSLLERANPLPLLKT